MIAGGALINALAFSGTNAIFSQIDDHGADEMKRHNHAMEQLSKAKDAYSRKRMERLDFINNSIRQQRHAEQTFSDLGVAMQQYYEVTGHQLQALEDPPKLSDFYHPSEQHKDGEILFIIGGMSLVALVVYKFL